MGLDFLHCIIKDDKNDSGCHMLCSTLCNSCIRSSQHHNCFYYAWPAGEMTRDILLTLADGCILSAVSQTGAEMSLSILASTATVFVLASLDKLPSQSLCFTSTVFRNRICFLSPMRVNCNINQS